MLGLNEVSKFSIISGTCASCGSICGKLSGIDFISPTYLVLSYALRGFFFGLMIFFNALVWRFYAKALQLSNSSLPPTIISTASNYIFSAIIGCLFFKETATILWWSGSTMILIGLILVTSSTQSRGAQSKANKNSINGRKIFGRPKS